MIFFSSYKLSFSPLQLTLKINWKQPLSAWKHCHKQPEWTDYHCSFTSSWMCSLQTAWMSFSDTKSGYVLYSRARCGSGGGRKRLQMAWKTRWKLKSGSPESFFKIVYWQKNHNQPFYSLLTDPHFVLHHWFTAWYVLGLMCNSW